MKIVLLGNAGSGKTTMARRLMLSAGGPVARLSLDEIAWAEGTTRRPLAESIHLLENFIRSNDRWIIEGCYSDLVAHALPHCTELRFLNPGVEACIRHCRGRPWEPDKYADPEAQRAMLDQLIEWVASYKSRSDEYSLARHRELFEGFKGPKREYTDASEYNDDSVVMRVH